jgi:hypothetical protein
MEQTCGARLTSKIYYGASIAEVGIYDIWFTMSIAFFPADGDCRTGLLIARMALPELKG